MITLTHFVVLSALLFSIGIFGVMIRKNAIGILMSLELMFNAVNINMVAFAKFRPGNAAGELFAILIIAVTAAESVLGLAIILAIYRKRRVLNADEMNIMKW